jgi:hypothetical protein
MSDQNKIIGSDQSNTFKTLLFDYIHKSIVTGNNDQTFDLFFDNYFFNDMSDNNDEIVTTTTITPVTNLEENRIHSDQKFDIDKAIEELNAEDNDANEINNNAIAQNEHTDDDSYNDEFESYGDDDNKSLSGGGKPKTKKYTENRPINTRKNKNTQFIVRNGKKITTLKFPPKSYHDNKKKTKICLKIKKRNKSKNKTSTFCTLKKLKAPLRQK